jgi:hypothetical protein
MRTALLTALCLVLGLGPIGRSVGQPPGPVPVGAACAGCPQDLRRVRDCLPRCGCPDDYCPNPLPCPCWPTYPPFYKCVPAGDGAPDRHGDHGTGRLTWWFVPTPRALAEALGR